MFLASQVWFHHILDVEQTATVILASLWVWLDRHDLDQFISLIYFT